MISDTQDTILINSNHKEEIEFINSKLGILCKASMKRYGYYLQDTYNFYSSNVLYKKQLFMPISCYLVKGSRYSEHYKYHTLVIKFMDFSNSHEYGYFLWILSPSKKEKKLKNQLENLLIPYDCFKTKQRNMGTKYQEIKSNENG